jgi:hypothetical protein
MFHGWPEGMSLLAVVVFTVTVTGTLVVPVVKATELGAVKPVPPLKLQVAPVGKPEQARVTVPVYGGGYAP